MNRSGKFLGAKGNVNLGKMGSIDFNLPLIIFEEDGVTICYCPALDLSGYGDNENEALDSYNYVMKEYFDYTSKKRTLQQDLKRLGWNIKNSLRKKMEPPSPTKLLERNGNFKRVFDGFNYKKLSTNVQIPALA